eukprot:1180059-Karenia_brevis.AAC.1
MGWSHALHCCQSVLLHALHLAGMPLERQIHDHTVCEPIICQNDVAVAGCVDDFAVLGPDANVVNKTRDQISSVLRDQVKLPVHDLQDPL